MFFSFLLNQQVGMSKRTKTVSFEVKRWVPNALEKHKITKGHFSFSYFYTGDLNSCVTIFTDTNANRKKTCMHRVQAGFDMHLVHASFLTG